jgi:hypothetical protein
MLALASVWIGLASLVVAVAMVVHRPWMTDLTLVLVLYFGSPGSLCLAGLVLWSLRKECSRTPGVLGQRRQARAAIVMAVLAAALLYMLVMLASPVQKHRPTA